MLLALVFVFGAVRVDAAKFSRSAMEKISAAGGEARIV